MITINLLKKTSSKRRRGIFSAALLVRIGIVSIVGLGIVVAGASLMRWWMEHPRTVRKAAVAAAVPEKRSVPAAPVLAPQPVPPPEKKAAAVASPTMSIDEKINYEITFAKNVFQKLTDAVPEGIGFGTISVDSFRTVSAVGSGTTREPVSTLYSNLRHSQLNLLGHPDSYIGKGDPAGYTFVFICKPSFDRNPADSFQTGGRLVSQKKLPTMLKTFSRLAARDGLYMLKGLSRRTIRKTDGYQQFVYHFSCGGTYRSFVKFILDLDKAQVPCAFAAVRITAINDAIVDISADINFTLRK